MVIKSGAEVNYIDFFSVISSSEYIKKNGLAIVYRT